MRKNHFFTKLFAVAIFGILVSLVGCTKDEVPEEQDVDILESELKILTNRVMLDYFIPVLNMIPAEKKASLSESDIKEYTNILFLGVENSVLHDFERAVKEYAELTGNEHAKLFVGNEMKKYAKHLIQNKEVSSFVENPNTISWDLPCFAVYEGVVYFSTISYIACSSLGASIPLCSFTYIAALAAGQYQFDLCLERTYGKN